MPNTLESPDESAQAWGRAWVAAQADGPTDLFEQVEQLPRVASTELP